MVFKNLKEERFFEGGVINSFKCCRKVKYFEVIGGLKYVIEFYSTGIISVFCVSCFGNDRGI